MRHLLPPGCCRDGPCIEGSKVYDNEKVNPRIGHTASAQPSPDVVALTAEQTEQLGGGPDQLAGAKDEV